jgi:hypothetical protein
MHLSRDPERRDGEIGLLREHLDESLKIDDFAITGRVGFPSSLQVGYGNEPFAVSEANTTTGSTPFDAW